MIHELRIYHAVLGRLPALLKRFERMVPTLWKKHGIREVGFWTVMIGPDNHALYYLLAWESLAERERVLAAFAADPEWHAIRAETETEGPLVATVSNQLLQPTAFSSVR